jgi:DNA-directed RNA polymerase specialized sigma24 family protein
MVELNQALEALSLVDAEKVQLVELRYFLGCTAEETAAVMQMSKSTVDRDLKFARVWLFRHMKGDSAKTPA